ncbi:MAG: UMP kinase [Gammaproteobacteria bacterium]|nr:UMP kinase [Gammaproteobacteria bacterium]
MPVNRDQAGSGARYRRILLKLSGEALSGGAGFGIDAEVLRGMAEQVGEIIGLGVQTGIVIGGGNLFRGVSGQASGVDRITGDHMGMLATIMNSLALRDALESAGTPARILAARGIEGVVGQFERHAAIRHLEEGRAVIFSGGTGNPLFTTDSAACLRGIEIGAEIIFKATRVDGVYSADPERDPEAAKFDALGYDAVIRDQLGVMDLTAICLARDNGMPIRVFDMTRRGALRENIAGEPNGTLIGPTGGGR